MRKSGWVTLRSQNLDGFINVNVEFSSTQVSAVLSPWQCPTGIAEGGSAPQEEEWNLGNEWCYSAWHIPNGCTWSCNVLVLCFPRTISTSHPRTEATAAGWHGKMDTHCSDTGLQPSEKKRLQPGCCQEMTELGGKGTDSRTGTFSRADLFCSYSCVWGKLFLLLITCSLSVLAC